LSEAEGSKPSNARPAFSAPLRTGHPERSRITREAHDPAESKDLYQKWVFTNSALSSLRDGMSRHRNLRPAKFVRNVSMVRVGTDAFVRPAERSTADFEN
jgi:hypothetical protein